MARPARLKPWLLLGLVLLAHAAGLEWLARQREALELMPLFAPPMYTRMLQPQAPAPVVVATPAPPKPRVRSSAVAVKPKPAASQAQAAAPAPPVAEPAPPEPVVAEPAPPPAPAVEAPVETAAAPEPAAVASATVDPLASWPADTRLSYRLDGQYRSGPLYGDARVTWQRIGERYQARIDISLPPWVSLAITSQGELTPEGLLPHSYEELRTNKRRYAQFGPQVLALENGKTAARPPGMQDTASQFVELAHRFATGREVLEVGRAVSFWMARPGHVDLWTYDIVARETLQTPQLGAVEAWRLKPRPIANPRGNYTAEIWFAPTLQYLPVRIRINMGSEAFVDLVVDHIEQR